MSQPETIEASGTPSKPHAVVRSQDAVVRCPECSGYGYFVDLEFGGEGCRKVAYKCKKCDGAGTIPVTPNPTVEGRESSSVPCTGVVLPSEPENQSERK